MLLIHKTCNRSGLFVIGIASLLLFLLAGCTSDNFFFEGYDTLLKGKNRPQIGILYYPYNKAMSQRLARPIPDYSGWPRERMVKDLHRLNDLGVDFIILNVNTADLKNSHRKSRYLEFFDLVANSQFPNLAFKITSENKLNMDERRYIINWLVSMCGSDPDAVFNFRGRCLVILPPFVKSWRQTHPSLMFRFTAPERRQWLWSYPGSGKAYTLGYQAKQATVYGGWQGDDTGNNSWLLPREKGRTLQHALRTVVGRGADIICVDSWNNFKDGSFIEPNTLDSRSVYKTLQEEIRRIKKAGSDRVTVTPR